MRRFAWLMIAATFGAGAIWALVPKGHHGQESSGDESKAGSTSGDNQPSGLQQAVRALMHGGKEPGDLSARRAALGDLLAAGDVPTKLALVLEAVAADPTPPESDPLWPDLIAGLAKVWGGDTVGWGLDLMFTEARPRARRALISSFAALASSERASELTPPQKQTLTNYFIDLYNQLPPSQQPEVAGALRKVAGNDVADIMLGKGLQADDELEGQREYKRALEQSKQVIAQGRQAAPATQQSPAAQ
jgi:hypothetical protein